MSRQLGTYRSCRRVGRIGYVKVGQVVLIKVADAWLRSFHWSPISSEAWVRIPLQSHSFVVILDLSSDTLGH